jgi:uncharacterized protein (TIGR00255 family)
MSTRVLSMTGYGRGRASFANHSLGVEVRALNHRGIDIKLRCYDVQLAPEIEVEITRAIKQHLARGSVSVTVREEAHEGDIDGLGIVDLARVRQLYTALDGLRVEIGLSQPVALDTVATLLGTARPGAGPELVAKDWPALAPAIESAIAGLCAMRAREGDAIRLDLELRLRNLCALVDRISGLVAGVPTRVAKRLEDRLNGLIGSTAPIDPARLAQEIAILVERLDVSEEIVRLRAHFDHMKALLSGEGKDAPGRRIDFLAQEIGRELNTLGGKIQDAAVAALVIEGKAELEKLREQAQNVE